MSERPLRPDAIISPSQEMEKRRLLADVVQLLPNLVRLVRRLLKDPRVPRRAKITLGLAAAYVASPIDLIPEVVPFLGWADDVLIIMLAVDSLIERAGAEIVEEHWDGPGDLLGLVREVVGFARTIIPRRLSGLIDRLSG